MSRSGPAEGGERVSERVSGGVSELQMLGGDILLTRTSQQLFGRTHSHTHSQAKQKQKQRHSGGVSGGVSERVSGSGSGSPHSLKQKPQLSQSLSQLPVATHSHTHSHDHDHDHDSRVAQRVKHSLEHSLEQLQRLCVREAPLLETVKQRRRRVLLLTLQMPNYLRLTHTLARKRRKRIFSQVFRLWKTGTVALRALEKFMYGRKMEAVTCMQRAWRRRRVMMRVKHRRYLAMKARQQQEHAAGKHIFTVLRKFIVCRMAAKMLREKRLRRHHCMALRIQRVFRGKVARAWRTEQLRLLLLQDLRDWAVGNIQKLIERPTQLDIYTEDLIRKAIHLVSTRPTRLRNVQPPRLIRIFRKQIRVAREREVILNAQAKARHVKMMEERALMAHHDREDLFKRHFRNVLAELEKQAAMEKELEKKREEEDAFLRKARAEVFHIVESMKLEGLLERSEREKMFREEYTLRRWNLIQRQRAQHWHDTDLHLMAQEDHLASRLRIKEREERETRQTLMIEQKKVKDLLAAKEDEARKEQQERLARGGNLKKWESTIEEVDPEEYLKFVKLRNESVAEVAALMDSVGNEQSPSTALCGCMHSWTSSLLLMKACARRVDTTVREAIDQSSRVTTVAGELIRLEAIAGETYTVKQYLQKKKKKSSRYLCQIDFKWHPDRNCLVKYRNVRALQHYRASRHQKIRALQESGEHFKQLHLTLGLLRQRMRIEKYTSRHERRVEVDRAVALEKEMEELEKSILENCLLICENGRLEKMNFWNLFCVHIGPKEVKNEKTKVTKKKKVPGYMQRKKTTGPVVIAAANKHDNDRKKMELSAKTGQLVEVIDEDGDSEVDDEELACPAACTISPKGNEQIVIAVPTPPIPPFVLMDMHLKRTQAAKEKIEARRRREEVAVTKQSLGNSSARNTPISKFDLQLTDDRATPSSKGTSKLSRLSMNANSSIANKDFDKFNAGGKNPRKSMNTQGNDDFDLEREKSLLDNLEDVELKKVIPKEGSRSIPGLSKYQSPDTHLYLPLVRIEEVKRWSHRMTAWYNNVERKWKESKKSLCLSFLQRARLLLRGSKSHRQLLPDDSSLAVILHRANAIDLLELLCCRRTLILRPSTCDDYVSTDLVLPSRKVDMLCGRHPFSLQTYFALLLAHQAESKKEGDKKQFGWTKLKSEMYTRDSLFFRLGLLQQDCPFDANPVYSSIVARYPIRWGCDEVSTSAVSSAVSSACPTPDPTPRKDTAGRKNKLKNILHQNAVVASLNKVEDVDFAATLNQDDLYSSHSYVMSVFAGLLAGLHAEKMEDDCFFNSLLQGDNLNIMSTIPGDKDGSTLGKLRKTAKKKPILRLQLSPTYSIGTLVQSYRDIYVSAEQEVSNLKSLEAIPNWMFPVTYWGKTVQLKKSVEKSYNVKNVSSSKDEYDDGEEDEDEELDEDIFNLEEKITSLAENLVKTLKRKANARIMETRNEIETTTKHINQLHMGFEDKLADTLRLENRRNYLMEETRKWKKKNGAPHKRLINFLMRRQVEAIVPFDEEKSLVELEAAVARLRWLKERLPSQKMRGGWTLCFTRLVGEPVYDLAESRRLYAIRQRDKGARSSIRSRMVSGTFRSQGQSQRQAQGQAQVTMPSEKRRHIRWTRTAGESYQKVLLARRMNSSLGEMIVCGGVRRNVLLARVVVDETNQPEGAIMLESMALPNCKHNEIASYMVAARIGFQGRELCEATQLSFAVTTTPSGRYLSEFGLRALRTELPGSELETNRLRQKVLWNIFKEARYQSADVVRTVVKIQALFRRRLATRRMNRIRASRIKRKTFKNK